MPPHSLPLRWHRHLGDFFRSWPRNTKKNTTRPNNNTKPFCNLQVQETPFQAFLYIANPKARTQRAHCAPTSAVKIFHTLIREPPQKHQRTEQPHGGSLELVKTKLNEMSNWSDDDNCNDALRLAVSLSERPPKHTPPLSMSKTHPKEGNHTYDEAQRRKCDECHRWAGS